MASFSASYPEAEGKEKINFFLSELVNNALSWFSEKLFEHAKQEYENDTDEKKRFHFKPYRYTLKIGAEERQDELCVTLDATLCRGKREELAHFYDTLTFDTEKEILKAPLKNKRDKK